MISQQEMMLFRSIKNEAIILMLMVRLDKPTGETEIGEILAMHPETVRNKLRGLARLGIVTRTHHKQGYLLTGLGSQLVLGATAENPRLGASIITDSLKELSINKEVVIEGATAGIPRLLPEKGPTVDKTVDNLGETVDKPEVWETLRQAGVMPNDRTRALVEKDFMDVDFVKGHIAQLRKARKLQPGLLITVCEAGAPAVALEKDEIEHNSAEARRRYKDWGSEW